MMRASILSVGVLQLHGQDLAGLLLLLHLLLQPLLVLLPRLHLQHAFPISREVEEQFTPMTADAPPLPASASQRAKDSVKTVPLHTQA